MRINIYRGQIENNVNFNGINTDVKVPDTIVKMPKNVKEQQIYKYVLKNGSITTAKVMELLNVKQRRARAVLLNMVENDYLRKKGAARNTIYVINMERK